jgi:hypothetical protein
MSAYGTKVVAVLDTQSAFGTTIKSMRDSMLTRGLLTENTLNIPTVAPTSPADGDIYFDKTALKLKIYVDDGNSTQWVQL